MKATGIVRRIDDLGRVVIPKEIRRTLRIKEGTPLEIFTDREGEIILKKYSPIGELSTFAESMQRLWHRQQEFLSALPITIRLWRLRDMEAEKLQEKRSAGLWRKLLQIGKASVLILEKKEKFLLQTVRKKFYMRRSFSRSFAPETP